MSPSYLLRERSLFQRQQLDLPRWYRNHPCRNPRRHGPLHPTISRQQNRLRSQQRSFLCRPRVRLIQHHPPRPSSILPHPQRLLHSLRCPSRSSPLHRPNFAPRRPVRATRKPIRPSRLDPKLDRLRDGADYPVGQHHCHGPCRRGQPPGLHHRRGFGSSP